MQTRFFAAIAMLATIVVPISSGIAKPIKAQRPSATEAGKTPRSHARTKRSHPVSERKSAEAKGYKKVSSLVNFPKFFPGLGIIYVKPETLPTGPFLCFDRKDRLVATVYMIPVEDIEQRKKFENVAGYSGKNDHVSLYFNSGHPGVDMPHYHFVLWHVAKKDEVRVAQ